MSETTTTKPVNLYQLGQEIGGNPSFRRSGPDEEGISRIWSSAAQTALDAAIAAHTADPSIVPPPPIEETNEATINDRLDQALTALGNHVTRAKPATAAAQASAAYDATVLLARVAISLVRLVRRRLEAVE